jgi:hypothetical protein
LINNNRHGNYLSRHPASPGRSKSTVNGTDSFTGQPARPPGWRALWRYFRDFDPNLASIRNEPEFKAVFADIERDMARQRAELAARPKNAPLNFNTASN